MNSNQENKAKTSILACSGSESWNLNNNSKSFKGQFFRFSRFSTKNGSKTKLFATFFIFLFYYHLFCFLFFSIHLLSLIYFFFINSQKTKIMNHTKKTIWWVIETIAWPDKCKHYIIIWIQKSYKKMVQFMKTAAFKLMKRNWIWWIKHPKCFSQFKMNLTFDQKVSLHSNYFSKKIYYFSLWSS